MIIFNIICKVILISQGFSRLSKNYNVILLILLTLLERLAQAQVCHVHPTPIREMVKIGEVIIEFFFETFDIFVILLMFVTQIST